MPLIVLPKQEWPRQAGWLVPGYNCTELEYQIVLRALRDDGIMERPRSSNRGVRIDAMTRRAGLTPPQYWCAIWVGAVWADAGAKVPRGYPSCDSWLPYIDKVDRKPKVGSAVLYGRPGDATHIGIVSRVEGDIALTIEGNRGYAGSMTNNGEAVDQAPMNRRDILGYVRPVSVG